MKPVTFPTTPANWLTRQLNSPEPVRGGDTTLAPEPRRRHSRYSTRQIQVESPIYGRVIDASEGGMRLESLSELPVAAEYTFRIRYRSQFLSLRGKVVWSRVHRVEETARGRLRVFRAGIELAPGDCLQEWLRTLQRLSGAAIGA